MSLRLILAALLLAASPAALSAAPVAQKATQKKAATPPKKEAAKPAAKGKTQTAAKKGGKDDDDTPVRKGKTQIASKKADRDAPAPKKGAKGKTQAASKKDDDDTPVKKGAKGKTQSAKKDDDDTPAKKGAKGKTQTASKKGGKDEPAPKKGKGKTETADEKRSPAKPGAKPTATAAKDRDEDKPAPRPQAKPKPTATEAARADRPKPQSVLSRPVLVVPEPVEVAEAPRVLAPAITRASGSSLRKDDGIPDQLTPEQRAGYRLAFSAIRRGRWSDARAELDLMGTGPLHPLALAELYTAKNSPRVEVGQIVGLLASAPDLPQADQLSRMAQNRGAVSLPSLPVIRTLAWYDPPPVRRRQRSVRSDAAATEIALATQRYIKADDGASAEGVLNRYAPDLTTDALTEWQQKVAWIYYVAGDDANARRVATMGQQGSGDWAPQADWVAGLAAWRQGDCQAAGAAFESVAARASDIEMRSAGLYWASRADMACDRPEKVQPHLRAAAQYGETFYGLLARQALGIEDKGIDDTAFVGQDWQAIGRNYNVRAAAALAEIGENDLADEMLRFQATIEDPRDHEPLTRIAGRLNLPSTQLWLSNHLPAGAQPLIEARYPAPNWTPAGGWRVDKALVFAHTLQESRFNAEIRSAANAIGLMQVKLGAATDVGRRHGVTYVSSDLTKPAVNMEIGQSYLEQLRDSAQTQGLLPKVIASYNAGPLPVQNWNTMIRDNGDPLLYIESIPYWETRAYVMIVLRNYWMYELQEGRRSPSREALVQGLWPRFPGLPGATAVKITPPPRPVQLDPSKAIVQPLPQGDIHFEPTGADAN
ncbi:transglycosylase SLT domain-containing protein [Sphingomonas sp.]|uniref:lytic transglycosylase domain-containing protein n=1 Tax=Sphingomonas sp. TaxID=28214 RepID=UPI0025F30B29|nr:transglycosylase SLT domain-containing protein [Sphingomonas sp.]